jgi:hypothetical protein
MRERCDIKDDATATPERLAARRPDSAQQLLALQRTMGNQAVGRMLQRAVIPVYQRAPKDEKAKGEDFSQVNRFARNAATGPNAGAVQNDLVAGGDLSAVQPPEKIILTGHGSIQSMQGYSGSELAGMLKSKWNLQPTFAGELRIDACEAGDKGSGWFGFYAASLVDDVSNALQGHQVTVTGLKGPVITPHGKSAVPGVTRSLTSSAALDKYNELDAAWRKLDEARKLDYELGGGIAELAADSAQLNLGMLELELGRLKREGGSMIGSVLSFVKLAKSDVEVIQEKMAAEKANMTKNKDFAASETRRLDLLYGAEMKKILQQMDAMGVPFGDASVTVSHGPAERAPQPSLASRWLTVITNTLVPYVPSFPG